MLSLLVINKASTWLPQSDYFELILEVLSIETKDVQQNQTVCILTRLVKMHEVGSYHDKETVRANSTLEILAVTTYW